MDERLLAENELLFGTALDSRRRRDLGVYLALLNKWSTKINLTTLQSEEEILRYHFFESFWVAEEFCEAGCTVIDIGSGAGFPGLAMRLYRPDLQVTLIEPGYRKAVFLKETVRALGYDVIVFQAAAEEYSQWAPQHLVTIRALKLSPSLLRVLEGTRCRLLYLHGSSTPLKPRRSFCETRPIPGSRQRFATLLDFGKPEFPR